MLALVKAVISGAIIAAASELAKRNPIWGGILVSIPLTSLLTAIWLRLETADNQKIANFLSTVFWAHLPTMVFFVLCPYLLRLGWNFWLATGVALLVTALVFYLYAQLLRQFGINLY